MDLLPWLVELATDPADADDAAMSPSDRLGLQLSEMIDYWMTYRGVRGGTISTSRRTLARVLKGQLVTLNSLVDIADALGCDVLITFKPRGAFVAPSVAELALPSCGRVVPPARWIARESHQ